MCRLYIRFQILFFRSGWHPTKKRSGAAWTRRRHRGNCGRSSRMSRSRTRFDLSRQSPWTQSTAPRTGHGRSASGWWTWSSSRKQRAPRSASGESDLAGTRYTCACTVGIHRVLLNWESVTIPTRSSRRGNYNNTSRRSSTRAKRAPPRFTLTAPNLPAATWTMPLWTSS